MDERTAGTTNAAAVRLHPQDDVAIALRQLVSGQVIASEGVTVTGLVPAGHKVATRALAAGAPVHRFNQVIGFATRPIRAGEHVHLHNMGMGAAQGEFERDYGFCADAKLTEYAAQVAQFQGIVRADGRVATRNYVGLLSSVNCSATVVRAIADRFRRDLFPDALAQFPNVDGVVALTHGTGCGMGQDEGLAVLRRTLAGYGRHANFGAVLMIGLGCESNQLTSLLAAESLAESESLQMFNIQDAGGTARSIARGVQLVREMLPAANQVEREPVSAGHLVVGLQCGGSDGLSGITANPALGRAVDLLVGHRGTAILSETPEIYGAEHLLTRRAATRALGERLLERVRWWTDYTARHGGAMNNNPSPGNKAGGLTTILEKSLGAIAKGGTTRLEDVYQYAQAVTAHGLVFMDTPGFDPVSATGQVAGGANLIVFTTGRGSAYGCAPAPSLKLSTNSDLWRRQQEDIDLNCGEIADGDSTVDELGARIFEAILSTASGRRTKSELFGYGQQEFVPWQLGAIM